MKKLPLLLTCTLMLGTVTVSAQAKTINTKTVYNVVRVIQQQKTKTDRITAARNMLKALGLDDDAINSLLPKSQSAAAPTAKPTVKPTTAPTAKPTVAPTARPTTAPTVKPTVAPTARPATAPTVKPTAVPTAKPTAAPTAKPTAVPTAKPTTAPSVSSESAMEQEVLRLVNEERAKYGLSPVKWADDLARVARAHCSDMIRRNFFDHTNPDGQSPFDRMKAAGISYRSAGENIAYGQKTAQAVMTAWMNSSGHRANILNSSYTELGVGAVKNSSGTIYWAQEFVKR